MKYFILILIVGIFGAFGNHYKKVFIIRKRLIEDIINYIDFYDANISVFKNDLLEINNKYIIVQNNKTANKCNILIKNNNFYTYNYEFFKKYLSTNIGFSVVDNYFRQIGKSEYIDEKNKNSELKRTLLNQLKKCENEIKTKGDLVLKILLAIGAVIAIILW